jgi:hypothetical protein
MATIKNLTPEQKLLVESAFKNLESRGLRRLAVADSRMDVLFVDSSDYSNVDGKGEESRYVEFSVSPIANMGDMFWIYDGGKVSASSSATADNVLVSARIITYVKHISGFTGKVSYTCANSGRVWLSKNAEMTFKVDAVSKQLIETEDTAQTALFYGKGLGFLTRLKSEVKIPNVESNVDFAEKNPDSACGNVLAAKVAARKERANKETAKAAKIATKPATKKAVKPTAK